MIKGNQATFLVAGSGGAVAQTRGVNGLIPSRTDNLSQLTATLIEQHDLVRRTGFNLFASQGDGKRIMQETSMKVINRTIDLDILSALASTTIQIGGAGTTGSLALVARALTKLGNAQVAIDEIDNMYFVISPAFYAYLLQAKEFINVQYIDIKRLTQANPTTGASKAQTIFRWAGFNWIVTPLVTGLGTTSELCYAYHKNSIGHAVDAGGITAIADYFREQDYSWARTSVYMGSKLLQNAGVVQVVHDGSAYA